MTIKDFYDLLPSTSKNIMSQINSGLMNNVWTGTGGVSAQDLAKYSQRIFVFNFTKELNPIVDDICIVNNFDLENLNTSAVNAIIQTLYLPYQDKWKKLWSNVYLQTYNPIWNVDGEESIIRTYEYGKKNTETKDFTIEHGRDSTDTETVTDNITDNDVYGFNSATPVGASKSTNNGERETVYSGADTDTHSGTDSFQESGVDTERITNTRGGNIGVTSTQNMLNQEVDFRSVFNYFEIVTNDIISELAVNIY